MDHEAASSADQGIKTIMFCADQENVKQTRPYKISWMLPLKSLARQCKLD